METEDTLTVAGFGQRVVKLGLVTQAQLNDALEEARTESGKQNPEVIFLTRVLERRGLLTNFQTSKIHKGDPDGYFLGGFRVLYKVSSGSFGRVFRADDPRTGRVAALKVLRRRWSEDQQKIDLFIREGKVGLTLKHPNIVEVLAINQDPSTRQYYIAMEFVEGGNLREILQIRKTLDVSESLRILEDATAGLAYAYSRGITHRDIKLTNLLISSQGEAKLVDFGLAEMFASMNRDEKVDRTVDYAGLERATNVKHGDVRSDIFFLGCVFFETLTGRPPVEMSKDRNARMRKQRFEEVKSLRAGEVKAPPSVYHLCETMLAFDPKRRYQTPSQLLEAVRAARRDISAPAGEAAAGGRPARSIFIAESDERLQDALRDKFKELGYRVLLAADPVRALDRYRQTPYDALIVDVGSVGEEGLMVFDRVLQEARDRRAPCAGVVVLSEEQADWAGRVQSRPNAAVLVRPVGLKQLHRTLAGLLNAAGHGATA
jgi:tRNA A-37 threonylcarbamoyl transferase component Bud32/CheY-like chemotaxis protein